MKVLGVEYQTVVTLDIPGHIAGITVNREKDFTDREAAFLTLPAPHLAVASGDARPKGRHPTMGRNTYDVLVDEEIAFISGRVFRRPTRNRIFSE